MEAEDYGDFYNFFDREKRRLFSVYFDEDEIMHDFMEFVRNKLFLLKNSKLFLDEFYNQQKSLLKEYSKIPYNDMTRLYEKSFEIMHGFNQTFLKSNKEKQDSILIRINIQISGYFIIE
jgi:hypothetical protein